MATRSGKNRDGAASAEQSGDEQPETAASLAALIQGLAKQISEQSAVMDAKMDSQTAAMDAKMDSQTAAMDAKMDSQTTAIDKKLSSQAAELQEKLQRQSAAMDAKMDSQTTAIDKKLSSQAAELQKRLQRQATEAAEKLEERIRAQLDAESDRLRDTIRKEMDAVRATTDQLQRGQEQQQQQLQDHSQELEVQRGRQDAMEEGVRALQAEVRSNHDSVLAQVAAVQREMYSRISVSDVQSRSVTPVCSDPVRSVATSGNGKLKAHPNSYNGSVAWQQYVTQYELIASLNNWSEVEMAKILCAHLQGPALAVLCTLTAAERENYAALTAALNERFGVRRTAESARMQLENRKKNSAESWLQFATELATLVEYAHPGVSADTRDVLTKDKFIQSLPSELRRHVKLARPATLSETINCTTEIDSILVAESEAPADRSYRRVVRQVQQEGDSDSGEEGDNYVRRNRGKFRQHNRVYGEIPTRERRSSDTYRNNKHARGTQQPSGDRISGGAQTKTSRSNYATDLAELRAEIDRLRTGQNVTRRRRYSDKTDRRRGACFICDNVDHYARACPFRAGLNDETNQKNMQ
jgi:hypothetical protein